jgi:hypothetical protein
MTEELVSVCMTVSRSELSYGSVPVLAHVFQVVLDHGPVDVLDDLRSIWVASENAFRNFEDRGCSKSWSVVLRTATVSLKSSKSAVDLPAPSPIKTCFVRVELWLTQS